MRWKGKAEELDKELSKAEKNTNSDLTWKLGFLENDKLIKKIKGENGIESFCLRFVRDAKSNKGQCL